jgi:hypothetical protein
MAKEKKKHSSLRDAIYYANPHNLSREVAKLGYKLSVKKTMMSYLIYMAVAILAGVLFQLEKIPMIIICLSGFFFIPIVLKNSYKNQFEQQRFSEITEYMEHMLYAFRTRHKILQSLNDVELSFRQGPMYDAIQEAKNEILRGHGRNIERNGLKKIEDKYPCERLRAIHKFMVEVEFIGGDFNEAIDLLLEDRTAWVDRTTAFQKDKRKWIINIIFAIVLSAAICLFIQRNLPVDFDLAANILVQIVTTIMIVADLIIYAVADSKMATDWLEAKHTLTDKQIEEYYNKVVNYNEESSTKKATITAVIMFVFGVIMSLFTQPYMIGLGAVFAIVLFFKPKLSYKSAKKALETEIAIKFPQWLMEISLQLQSNNVQVAIFNSIPTAPTVLKKDLRKMQAALDKQPESVIPFLDFMKEFDVPEIQSSMKMLYSISSGTGGDPKKQIAEIIRRNNMLLDKSEKNAFDAAFAGLYGLFMAPAIVGSGKLLIDMMVFFVLFMGQMRV